MFMECIITKIWCLQPHSNEDFRLQGDRHGHAIGGESTGGREEEVV